MAVAVSRDRGWKDIGFKLRLAAAILAVLATAALSAYVAGRTEQTRAESYLRALAETEASRIDGRLGSYKAALLTIARSEALVATGDLEVLRREAERVGGLFGGWFTLATAGPTLEMLMNTGRPGPLPQGIDRSTLPEVAAADDAAWQSGMPAVSDAFLGQMSGTMVVALAETVPERDRDEAERMLYMVFETGHLSALLAANGLPEGHFAAIADGSRRVIARSELMQDYALSPLPDWFVEASDGVDSAVLVGPPIGAPDVQRYFALQRLAAAPNWTLVVSGPYHGAITVGLRTIWPALSVLAVLMLIGAIFLIRARYALILAAREKAEVEAAEKSALLEALQAAETQKTKLIGIVGHELRTPLIAQLGVLDLLEGSNGNAKRAPLVARARREAAGMLELLNDLLELARIGTGEMRLRPVPVDPGALASDVVEVLRPLAAQNGNAVTLSLSGDPGPVLADPAGLRRILINFGSNAAKFTHDGKITVGLVARPVVGDRLELELSVTDTGIGIAPEDQPKLFREFAMLEATQHLGAGGTGLGLAICRGLAEAMGGQVSVTSAPGVGSRFAATLTLPRASALPAPDTATAENGVLRGLRILLAEDQDIILQMTRRRLKAAGADVLCARDGAEAVALAGAERPDVILMDLRMPKLDGIGAARAIRTDRDGRNAEVPIIGLTADPHPDTDALVREGVLTACLTKPVDPEALCDHLDLPEMVTGTGAGLWGEAALIDADAVDWLVQEPDFAADLFARLESEIDSAMRAITAARQEGDLREASDLAHGLSGLAKVCGARALARALDGLDQTAKAGDAEAVAKAAGRIGPLAEATRIALAARVASVDR
jgi:signal transduction histidine kinase/HPt (histidine-containing phosphotransfer) domain-containing protein